MTKIPFQISATSQGGKTAQIRITGEIGWDNNAEAFRKEVDDLVHSGATEAEVYINSPGGSCFDANEIVNILSRFKTRRCSGGALVASAAAYIAISCDTFTMPQNGMLMIHRPHGVACGKSEDMDSYSKALKSLEKIYADLFRKKTNNPKEFEKNWGSDWWLTAREAQELGYATTLSGSTPLDGVTVSTIRACGCPVEKIATQQSQINTNMNELVKIFGLKDSATEAEILVKVQALLAEKKELSEKLSALQASIEAELQKKKEQQVQRAKEILSQARKDGRIGDDATQLGFEKMFAADFDITCAVLEGLPRRSGVVERIRQASSSANYSSALAQMNWDELDRKGMLATLKESDPEMFKEKFKERFGKEYTE